MGKVFIADNGLKLAASNLSTSSFTKVPNWEDVEVETIPSNWSNDQVTKDYTAEDDCWVVASIRHSGSDVTGDWVYISINDYNVSGNASDSYGASVEYDTTQPVFIKKGTNYKVIFGRYRNDESRSIARTLKVYIYGCKEPWE